MRERVILYSDLNNFFASVEMLLNPELCGKPLIVCGDPKKRLGVVLAKNEEAKSYGIKTAETVAEAMRKCPRLLACPPHHGEYVRYSRKVREIYERFTDLVEECSIDECALDVTASVAAFGSGAEIAEKIRKAVKEELSLTVSVGVSFNKIYAKLASDMKKPDAVTVVSRENYRDIVYPLPASDLLFVGKSTAKLLAVHGIRTIGELANADEETLVRLLGKRGRVLRINARGEDNEPVKSGREKEDVKSVGNSMTLPADVTDFEEIKRLFFVLAESVAARLREADAGKARTVHIVVRNQFFKDSVFQKQIPPTALCADFAGAAFELFCANCGAGTRVHMLGLTVSGFDYHVEQLRLGDETEKRYEKNERAELAVEKIRKKHGFGALQRGILLENERLVGLDLRRDRRDDEE